MEYNIRGSGQNGCPRCHIQGTKDILQLGDANQFGGEVRYLPSDPREGGIPQVSAGMPCHVLDVIEKIMESGKRGWVCTTETVCDRPTAFEN